MMETNWNIVIRSDMCPYINRLRSALPAHCYFVEHREKLKPTIDRKIINPQSTECKEELCPFAVVEENCEEAQCFIPKETADMLFFKRAGAFIPNKKLREIHSALDKHLGDTDPYFPEDITDDEIRDEDPVFWAAKELAVFIKGGDADA